MLARVPPHLIALTFFASACSDAGDMDAGDEDVESSQSDDDSESDPPGDLVLTSFNVSLAFGFIADAEGRVDPIISALTQSDADLICLQELWVNQSDTGEWTQNVIDDVLARTAPEFPHQYWVRTHPADDTMPIGCDIAELEPLEECTFDSCGDVPAQNIADCVLAECPNEFGGVSAGCQSCLVSNLGSPLGEILDACKGVTSSGIAWDGHNGLAVLSRHPLTTTEALQLEYALTNRSALHVVAAPEGGEPFDAYCTHLAANLSGTVSYPEGGPYGSFTEENLEQSNTLLDWAEQTAQTQTVALLGDFNHGEVALPMSYQAILDAGYRDPLAEAGPLCSICADNTLRDGEFAVSALIDHVYVKTPRAVSAAEIVFDEVVAIDRADGTRGPSNLSDHYGAQVRLAP